jgi:hypothetical protein
LKVNPENRDALIGERLSVWAKLAKDGETVSIRARGRHNFKMLARDNPKIAHDMSVKFGYLESLKELTPEIPKSSPMSLGARGRKRRSR